LTRSPVRTCVGCRTPRSQAELLRFRRRRDGVVVPSLDRRGVGRSAYVCPRRACLLTAVQRRGFERALGRASRGGGAQALAVRVPPATELVASALAELHAQIDLLNRTGDPRTGSRLPWLVASHASMSEPGRDD